MKQIDITTAQNVRIEYKAATVFERMLAWLLDIIFIVVSILILFFIIILAVPHKAQNSVLLFLLTPILLYHLIFELFNNGASPGKKILGLRVIKISNEPVSTYDYFMRWVFRIVDITASSGIIAVTAIFSSPRNQRIGDYLADTTVIKLMKTERFSLHRILQLNNLKGYKPVYPEAVAFSENDMLVFKEVIERFMKYPSETSDKILQSAIDKAETILGIKVKYRNVDFLRTLIKDYVALTR